MKIEINPQLFIPLIPFLLGILFKALLDLNLAIKLVKYFHLMPVRFLFRIKPIQISGKWTQLWENNVSQEYKSEESRKSEVIFKQFGKYCYGEYRIKNDELYYVFGELKGNHFIGKWGNVNNEFGYFGVFELYIKDPKNIEGLWIGHSSNNHQKINLGKWYFKKI